MDLARKTDVPSDTNTDLSVCSGIQINLAVKKSSESLKIEVQGFNDLNIIWLTKIYSEYEGQIWAKHFTDERNKFVCRICNKILGRFNTLRSHLNMHLQIHPFKCYACEKKYASYSSLYKHRASKHDDN